MKKFMNSAENVVPEMLEGIVAAHPDQLTFTADDIQCIVKGGKRIPNKVGIATGGGSGHLPLFLGYVGNGLLDGCSVGDVFQSPSAEQMLNVTKAIHSGAGVLYIYGNYSGDVINFDMAAELASMEDIVVQSVARRRMLLLLRKVKKANDEELLAFFTYSNVPERWPMS